MTPKQGVLHDYDLQANRELAARKQECVVCGAKPMAFQWSDYSGEAMCTLCGTPYQLKWGSEEQKAEGHYPYLNLREEWVPVLRRYYQETGRFTCLGIMMGEKPGLAEFDKWVTKNNAVPEGAGEGA